MSGRQEGWDWFALQLDDGATLMFYFLRERDGTWSAQSAGTWVESDGTARYLQRDDVRIEAMKRWKSPRGGVYPARWRMHIPSLSLNVEIEPVLADQELGTSPRYWEGAVDIVGSRAGRQVGGRGYVELVGYATAVKQR